VTLDAFFDHLGDLDWLSVLVGTAALVVAGTLWYGPLFGKPWSKAVGVKMQTTPDPSKVVATIVYSFAVNLGVSYFAAADAGLEHALVAALVYGVLLVAPVLFSAVVWARKSATAFLIDAAWWTAAIFLATYVQSLLL
jgi:hypothetical protein